MTEAKKSLIPAFWQAVLVIVIAYLLFKFAFPPLLPRSLMIQYMIVTVVGVLLYFSFDEQRWTEFKIPITSVLRDDNKVLIRWGFLLLIPALIGYTTYGMVKPSLDAPMELRQVHPAPPSSLKVFGKRHDLSTLENPIRMDILKTMRTDPEQGWKQYRTTVRAGRDSYYQNCFYCHGDLLDGKGPYASGFNPLPANFQGAGTIAQLQEAYLFWRITTGGPGLPVEGTPWNSAMPVWHEMLNEQEVWNIITFLYDYVGQVPRMWDPQISREVTSIKDQLQKQRANMQGKDLYDFRCAVCHGDNGAGDGAAAEFMYPKPRDFTLGLFKYKTSPPEMMPKDKDLFDTVKHGLPGTGMPGWSSLLSDKQMQSLVPVIKGFDITANWAPEDADDDTFDEEGRYTRLDFIQVTENEGLIERIAYSEESVTRGKARFEKICGECHGKQGRGNIISGKKLEDDWGNRTWPRDLTKPWSWRATEVTGDVDKSRVATIGKIYQRLSIGIPGTPMPAHRGVEGNKDPVSTEDRWHIANYVYSLRHKSVAPRGGVAISAQRVEGGLPSDVNAAAWEKATPVSLPLVPNIIKEERLFTPLNDEVTVRVLYNQDEIAFLLEINDRTDSRPGEPVSQGIQDEKLKLFADAVAIQFPKEDAFANKPVVKKPLYRHGDAARHTTIWYWNAGSMKPQRAARATLLEGSGPDKKPAPRMQDQSLQAQGQWTHGRWRVIMKRPRKGGESGDINFDEGRFMPISFANWDGSNGEVGARHTLTTWYWLVLPPELDSAKVYGVPAGVTLGVFLMGLLLVRSQRKKGKAPRSKS